MAPCRTMAWDRIRQLIFGSPPGGPFDSIEPPDQQQIDMIAAMGQRMVDVVNESMRIAHNSKNIETRRSRVRVAKAKILELGMLAAEYPSLKIEQLADVERDLARIDRATDALSNHRDAMTAANQARLEAFRKNSRFMKGVRWLATLDGNCCIACAALDGTEWNLEGQPIGDHDFAFCVPPLHDNCRCVVSPIPKGIDEIFGTKGLDAKMAPDTRASKDGPTDAVTFDAFLKRQDRAFLEEMLGAERAQLLITGGARLRDFINSDARVLSIDELRHRLQPD